MRIKAPLTHQNEVKPLCDAGADEFFCGIEPYSWRKKYKNFSINQRSNFANFKNFSEFSKAITIAHKQKAKVHVTINAFFYLPQQYALASRIIKQVVSFGADGIIVADPVLLLDRDKKVLKGKEIIAGTDAVVFNSASCRFYKKLGVTRVVLPRAMTIGEIKDIVSRDKTTEYEVFIINDLCFFIDGLCTHCKEDTGAISKEGKRKKGVNFLSGSRLPGRGYQGGCRTVFRREKVSFGSARLLQKSKKYSFWMGKNIQGCGACALYDLKKIGITSVKVLDRNLPTAEKIQATQFIKKCSLLLAKRSISKGEYSSRCKDLFEEAFKTRCNIYNCYYPSAFLS